MELVKVVIPIYKDSLTDKERISLRQACKVLSSYRLVVIHPQSLNLSKLAEEFPLLTFESFEDHFFAGISGYNRLMLSSDLYQRFINCEYILIYQLDAFVFRDELKEWCEKGYDYIGAPWLRKPIYNLPIVSSIIDLIHSYHKLKGEPSKQALFNKVGNGGLSLRRVQSHYRVTQDQAERIKFYISQKRHHLYNEDVFWATEAEGFKYPEPMEAIGFSFDKYPAYCFRLNGERLPFGCHAWYSRKMRAFWKKFIKQ